jgi:hypothetical protein
MVASGAQEISFNSLQYGQAIRWGTSLSIPGVPSTWNTRLHFLQVTVLFIGTPC